MVERDDCMRGGAYDKGVLPFFTGGGSISPDYMVSILSPVSPFCYSFLRSIFVSSFTSKDIK